MTGKSDGPPIIPGTQIGDYGGGYAQAMIGILLALLARERTGKGQFVDISMLDGLVFWTSVWDTDYLLTGIPPHRGETALTGRYPCYNIYETKGGGYLTLGILEQHFWENLCRVLEREDFFPYIYDDGEKRNEILTFFRQIFTTKTAPEWIELLRKNDIPCGPVNTYKEAFDDPQILHRQMLQEVKHPTLGTIPVIGVPIKLSETPGKIKTPPPGYGEHTNVILEKLGYSSHDIDDFRERGIIE
jgi:crotonobetainyl-CoA:carnitine CoA-transferase CaiB-like acyl-CoA transferase